MGRNTHQTPFRKRTLSCANILGLSRYSCGIRFIFSCLGDDEQERDERERDGRRFDIDITQLKTNASSTSTSSTYKNILDAEEYISNSRFVTHSTGPSAQYENKFNVISPIRFETVHRDIREMELHERMKKRNTKNNDDDDDDDDDIDSIRRELEEFIHRELKEFEGAAPEATLEDAREATSEERISSKKSNFGSGIDIVVNTSLLSATTEKASNRKTTTHERINSPRYHTKLPLSSKLSALTRDSVPMSPYQTVMSTRGEKIGFFAPISRLFRAGRIKTR